MKGFSLRTRWAALLLPMILLGFLAAPLQAKPKRSKSMDMNDYVSANRILRNFTLVVQGSGLASFLSSRGPLTLFAPTDSAFSKLPPGALQALLRPENQVTLQRILLFHLVNGRALTAKDLIPLKSVVSCDNTPLPLRVGRSGAQLVLKAKILHADIRCANGLIHEIDTVLVPPGISLTAIASAPPAPPVNTNTPANPAPPVTSPFPGSTSASPASAEVGSANPAPPIAPPLAIPPATNSQ